MTISPSFTSIYERPAELLQHLIRFNTTNPPGNEAACIQFLDELLQGAGIQTRQLALEPERPNLYARLRGRGGHGSMLEHGGAMFKLAQALQKLDRRRLPVHITPASGIQFLQHHPCSRRAYPD